MKFKKGNNKLNESLNNINISNEKWKQLESQCCDDDSIFLTNNETVVYFYKEGGKWREGQVEQGEDLYGFGSKSYMGYMGSRELANWMSKDYGGTWVPGDELWDDESLQDVYGESKKKLNESNEKFTVKNYNELLDIQEAVEKLNEGINYLSWFFKSQNMINEYNMLQGFSSQLDNVELLNDVYDRDKFNFNEDFEDEVNEEN